MNYLLIYFTSRSFNSLYSLDLEFCQLDAAVVTPPPFLSHFPSDRQLDAQRFISTIYLNDHAIWASLYKGTVGKDDQQRDHGGEWVDEGNEDEDAEGEDDEGMNLN